MQKLNKNQVLLVYIQSLTPINSLQQQFSSTDFLEEANKQEVEIETIFESSRFGRNDNENENEPPNKPEYQAHILSPKITAELKAVSASESIGSIPRVSDLIKQLLVGSGCQSVKKFPTGGTFQLNLRQLESLGLLRIYLH